MVRGEILPPEHSTHPFDVRERERVHARREIEAEILDQRRARSTRDFIDFLLETPSERWLRRMQ